MRAALVLLALPGAALAASGAVYLDDSALASRAAASARFLALVQQQEDPGRPHAALFVAGEASQAGGAPAVGSFNDTLNALGWTNLWIAGNTAAFDDEQVAYAAGYLEGVLTWERIWHTLVNTGANFTWDPALEAYLVNNSAFMHQNVINASGADPYWYQLSLVLLQLQGVYDGYSDTVQPGQQVPFRAFLNIQLGGDMDDLSAALGIQTTGKPAPHPRLVHRHRQLARAAMPRASDEEVEAAAAAASTRVVVDEAAGLLMPTTGDSGHCSAVIRPLTGTDGTYVDILISQVTWSGFEDMVRIYKRYDLPYRTLGHGTPTVPGVSTSFSSFGASLFSGDDWYQVQPSALVVLETTIGNSNATLYQLYIKPTTVLDWMRNILANRLASDCKSWASTFSRYNSGTYNNEFFVLDYKKFSPGMSTLAPDTFWVLDQAPGYIVAGDRTADIAQPAQGGAQYFASYNIPSWPFIYDVSGEAAIAAKLGPWFTWNATARANIFRRGAPLVADEPSFRALVRYNNFTKDPLSTQGCEGLWPPYSAENAVAARDDLNPANGTYSIDALGHRDHAAIDAKYANYASMAQYAPGAPDALVTYAQAGPTYDTQPPFSWLTTTPDIAALAHIGMPDEWTMPWVTITGAGVTPLE